jgi:hypothetical protein
MTGTEILAIALRLAAIAAVVGAIIAEVRSPRNRKR